MRIKGMLEGFGLSIGVLWMMSIVVSLLDENSMESVHIGWIGIHLDVISIGFMRWFDWKENRHFG